MTSNFKKLIPSIILFLLGFGLTIVGALFKIQHWPGGNAILIIGNIFQVLAILFAIIVLLKIYRSKNS